MPKSKKQLKDEARKAVSAVIEGVIEEKVAEGERIPGKEVHGLKTPWTEKDVWDTFGGCTFVPGESIPVTYNGVRFQLLADRENHMPTIVRDIYLEHVKRTRRAGKSIPGAGFETTIAIGAGGLPPEAYKEI